MSDLIYIGPPDREKHRKAKQAAEFINRKLRIWGVDPFTSWRGIDRTDNVELDDTSNQLLIWPNPSNTPCLETYKMLWVDDLLAYCHISSFHGGMVANNYHRLNLDYKIYDVGDFRLGFYLLPWHAPVTRIGSYEV